MEKIIKKSAYECARDKILDYILENELYGERLPSEVEFAQMMGISRNTVREAIRVLEQEGMVYSRHGVGTFVVNKSKGLSTNITILSSISDTIRNHGYKAGTQPPKIYTVKADSEMADKMDIREGEEVLCIERVRTADGTPVILVKDYILGISGGVKEYMEKYEESLFGFLQKNYKIEVGYSNCTIKAAVSDDEINEKLQLDSPTALILLEQFHYTPTGRFVFYSDSYFISNLFNFSVVRQRKN